MPSSFGASVAEANSERSPARHAVCPRPDTGCRQLLRERALAVTGMARFRGLIDRELLRPLPAP